MNFSPKHVMAITIDFYSIMQYMEPTFNQPPKNTFEIKNESSDFSNIVKEAQARTDFYDKTIIQDIEIPNFPSKVEVVWNTYFGDGRFRGVSLKINRKETSENLVEISIGDTYEGDMENAHLVPHYFDVHHRFVHTENMTDEEKQVKNIGSFSLQKAEEIVRFFVKELKDPLTTNEIGMLTNQLDVFRFAQKNGYQIHNAQQKESYEQLMQEMSEHQKDNDFIERGILPNYRFIELQIDTPHGPEYTTQGVIVDMKKLKKYCDEKKPDFEKYSHLLEDNESKLLLIGINEYTKRKRSMRADEPHPFFLDFYLSKSL